MQKNEAVGERIARIRKTRGLTQHQLASLAHVGRGYLSRVEAGIDSPTSMWVGGIASALGVDASILMGAESEAASLDRIVPTVRQVVASTDPLADVDPLPLDILRLRVDEVARWRHEGAYSKIVEGLPDLVDHLLVAGQRDGAAAYELLVTAYRAGNTLAHKTGHYDLSTLATDRMVWAAGNAEDELLLATAQYVKTAALARVGAMERAVRLTDRTIATVEPYADDEMGAAVLCALHMRRAGLASTAGDAETTDTHFAEAYGFAEKIGDRQAHGTVVGPTNVKLFELSAAVDLRQVGKAKELAEQTQIPTDYPRERKAHFYLDVARAHLSAGEPDAAVDALVDAKESAPEYFRKSRSVETVIKTTAAHERRASSKLRALAHYAGIQD
ncbi:helix-turn-helix domain-containing protein [Nocardia sp. CY41]|uniref:helix-turn-helix domain-containing protein n=1 Tax=Nocardia sp. CY41 TaxID=2608686 RepID=UPI001358AFBB|nr:helix-turn-helix domain-containing protein [Nocardia sp. CY41]